MQIVESGSLARALRQLFIVQPSVSRQMARRLITEGRWQGAALPRTPAAETEPVEA